MLCVSEASQIPLLCSMLTRRGSSSFRALSEAISGCNTGTSCFGKGQIPQSAAAVWQRRLTEWWETNCVALDRLPSSSEAQTSGTPSLTNRREQQWKWSRRNSRVANG